MDITGKLLKIYKEKIEALVGNGIAPYYYTYLQGTEPSATNSDVLYAVCLFADIIEFGSNAVSY